MQVQNKILFSDLKAKVSQRFKEMLDHPLFYVIPNRDEIWEQYISGFEGSERQKHNCNCCKSFLRQFGGLCNIIDNKMVSIWDGLFDLAQYEQPVNNLKNYIHMGNINEIFLAEQAKCGTNQNFDPKNNVTWQHFFIEVPKNYVKPVNSIPTLLSAARDDKNVLKRSLEELSQDATETVLELIAQNSLYKGKEFEPMVRSFWSLQDQYKKLPQDKKDGFCWLNAPKSGSVARIRNTAIGTLLIDLSEGMELDQAVTKFERVVAPTNYKRPTSLVTPKMVEDAKKTIQELGLLESLERRYANETDISLADIIFSNRQSALTDVFQEVAKETIVNPRSLSKIEEISIEDFLKNVVPTAKSISVLLENSHLNNLVTILTSQDKDAKSMFKWDNNFSWSYTGGITDSIKERVKAAGGNVSGVLRTSLSWSNYDDLDLHMLLPNGDRICYYSPNNPSTMGRLDVDMNAGGRISKTPVENIVWTDEKKLREGLYTVIVNNYNRRENVDSGFTIQIEFAGEIFEFSFNDNPKSTQSIEVVKFEYSKANGIRFTSDVKSNVSNKEKWNLKTNQLHKVTKLMLSPNFWDNKQVGNKHYLFMLEDCKSDEAPRPFFNEFIKPELEKHRKVFEILGSKVKIEQTNNQLSGLGFSETQRNHVIVKVEGKFQRLLKVVV